MSDGLFALVGLAGAIAGGQSNCGNRNDGKICTGQAGECRYNPRYYSPGMRDAKSWSMPCADESCPGRCCYLREPDQYVEPLPEEERYARAFGLIEGLAQKAEQDRLSAALALGMMGIDPRTVLDDE